MMGASKRQWYQDQLNNTLDAEQFRNERRIRQNKIVENKDADDLMTTELMLSKSLEFEACQQSLKEAKEIIKSLLLIIGQDQMDRYRSKLALTPKEHILIDKAKKL
ncbi:MAG: hypothetical protein O2887_10440 [Bacteroidetes bacterium]|nr:hypothetical protein [Bacteroidota bacterium]